MIYKTLGNSDINISAITFGAWALGGWMWGGTEQNKPEKAILTGIDNGITAIDTAPVYGFGYREKLVGKAVKNIRNKIIREKTCPRCGPGVFLMKAKGREYCGKCHYTTFESKEESEKKEA